MKKLLLFTLVSGLLSGCDAPQRTRAPGSFQNMNGVISPTGTQTVTGTTTPSNMESGTLAPATGTTETATTANDPNFPICDLTAKYSTAEIGQFGLCQSQVNETLFKVKFANTTSVRNCLIPLYKDAQGSSTYIGQPQCTAVNQSNTIIQGTLLKNRASFETYPLNGVIVMREPLLPQYFKCMHAYINWLPQACPNGPNTSPYCYQTISACPYGAKTNATCDQAARSYMSQVCNNFKSTNSNNYIDIRTR